MTPFDFAMQALEDAHRMLFVRERQDVARRLECGATPASISTLLREIDETERNYSLAREALRELAA